ncbi:efflux RND transporter periplasmic adaptor subunit [Endozoicomonas lisbonensis]|uniref:RND family efflux transporter MFP subunit n=1 Tax=Endozoicomonas lisbonensis TaxID=3120522 RepID=A0ABV2SF10_9GAMM
MGLSIANSKKWAKIIAPCIVLIMGVAAASYYLESKPRIRSRQGQPVARLVQVQTIESGSQQPWITGNGQVVAKREVDLRSQQRGTVVSLPDTFIPGGFVHKGEVLLQIDPRDHLLQIEQSQAGLAKARATLEEERGRHRVAQLEYDLSGKELPDDEVGLVLRQPQLADAEANLKRAQAALSKARIDYERTRIEAPFDAQITARHISIGSMARDNMSLFELVATDAFWVEVSLPTQYLPWLKFPSNNQHETEDGHCTGSVVRIRNVADWQEHVYREGCVISLLPELNSRVRTATVLVEIKDPLALLPENRGKPQVLVNEFLQADILGKQVDNVVSLPRRLLQNGNRVWLMNTENKLESREVTLSYRGRDHVLVDGGLVAGEKLVTSAIPGAVEGIALRTEPRRRRRDMVAQQEPSEAADKESL